MPGALSAVGILLADTVRDYSRTVMLPADAIENIQQYFAELEERGVAEFTDEGLQGVAERTRRFALPATRIRAECPLG